MKVKLCRKCATLHWFNEKRCKFDGAKLFVHAPYDFRTELKRCPECERMYIQGEVTCKADSHNLINPIVCCAKCGGEKLTEYNKYFSCYGCSLADKNTFGETPIYISKKPKSYYEAQSEKLYGAKDSWESLFVEEELSKNPHFDRSRYQRRIEKEKIGAENLRKYEERQAKLKQLEEEYPEFARASELQPNTPHCPTCGSTNLRKIGNLERGVSMTVWGFASSKMGKQFECKDCGYKF